MELAYRLGRTGRKCCLLESAGNEEMEQHLTPDKLPLHFAYTSAFAFDDLSDVDCALDTGSVGGPAGGAAMDFLGVVTNFWTHVGASNEDDTHFLNGIA